MEFSKNTILLLVLISIITVAFFFKTEKQSSSEEAISSSNYQSASSNLKLEAPPEASKGLTQLTSESLHIGSASEFARKIEKIDPSSLPEIASVIISVHRDNPELALEWLETLSLELTSLEAHSQAIRLLDLVAEFEETPAIEGRVFDDWILSDSNGVLSYFQELADVDEIPHRQLSVIAALFQGGQSNNFGTYLSWIDQTESDLKGSLLESLVPHLRPENIEPVSQIILENLDDGHFEVAFYDLLSVRALDDPTQNLEWLSELRLNEEQAGMHVRAYEAVIRNIARVDVDRAVDILDQDDFLTNYAPFPTEELINQSGNWSSKAHWFFDAVLQSFIEEIRETDPALARDAAEVYFDPLLREEYRELLAEN